MPGGSVDWESETDPGQVATECPIGDLSRGGVRFHTPGPPRAGTRVRLTLHVPGESDALELRGSVVWTLVSSGQMYDMAVGFSPYGATPGENPPTALERLAAIEERFLAKAP